jgi:hypothetical protein
MSKEFDAATRSYAYSAKKYVHSKKDFPTEPHLAIIEFGSITIPGDQRSRDFPGHGYPESTQSTMSYIAYKLDDRWVWENDILERMSTSYRKDFIALDQGKMVEPKLEVKISI